MISLEIFCVTVLIWKVRKKDQQETDSTNVLPVSLKLDTAYFFFAVLF